MANFSSVMEAVKRPALDPGVLFGVVNLMYYGPLHPLYMAVAGMALLLAVVVSALRLFPEFKMLPLFIGTFTHAIVGVHALVAMGIDGAIVWAAAIPFMLSTLSNALELSFQKAWDALPKYLRLTLTGENFSAIANGVLLYFSGGAGPMITAISVVATVAAIALTMIDRSAEGRFILGLNALVSTVMAALNGQLYFAMAALFTALGCFRIAWLKKVVAKQSAAA